MGREAEFSGEGQLLASRSMEDADFSRPGAEQAAMQPKVWKFLHVVRTQSWRIGRPSSADYAHTFNHAEILV
eukprot:5924502-Amphidinium_carterae.2